MAGWFKELEIRFDGDGRALEETVVMERAELMRRRKMEDIIILWKAVTVGVERFERLILALN